MCRPGNCAVIGENNIGPFAAILSGSAWGQITSVTSITGDDVGSVQSLDFVSCPVEGDCTAVGTYEITETVQSSDVVQTGQTSLLYTMSESNGVWGVANEVPNFDGDAPVDGAFECTSVGNCVLGGSYSPVAVGTTEAFLDAEDNGTWGSPVDVPGVEALNLGNTATITAISCVKTQNCTAGGTYWTQGHVVEGFVTRELNGVWRKEHTIKNSRGVFPVTALSCSSVNNCAAVGNASTTGTAELDLEVNGAWRPLQAISVAGRGRRIYGDSLSAIACVKSGYCAAVGSYLVYFTQSVDASNQTETFQQASAPFIVTK